MVTLGIMANSKNALALVLRPPSLKGHSVEKRLHNRHGARVYQAINRRSLLQSQLYLPIASRTSIAGVTNLLDQADVVFQALRLRNGDLCFLVEIGSELNEANSGESLKDESQRTLKRAVAVLLALATSILGFLLWANELPDRAVAPSPVAPSVAPMLECIALLEALPEDLEAFLEEGSASTNYEFETVTSLQNGGLRSVDVRVTCTSGIKGAGDPESSQQWRATLKKSELSWVVTKMTRLEN
jgi:hypothetical protein